MNYKMEAIVNGYADKLKTLKVGDYSYEGLLLKFLLDLSSEVVIEFVE